MNFVATARCMAALFSSFAIRKEKERNIEWRKVMNSNNLSEWENQIDENNLASSMAKCRATLSQAFFDLKKW